MLTHRGDGATTDRLQPGVEFGGVAAHVLGVDGVERGDRDLRFTGLGRLAHASTSWLSTFWAGLLNEVSGLVTSMERAVDVSVAAAFHDRPRGPSLICITRKPPTFLVSLFCMPYTSSTFHRPKQKTLSGCSKTKTHKTKNTAAPDSKIKYSITQQPFLVTEPEKALNNSSISSARLTTSFTASGLLTCIEKGSLFSSYASSGLKTPAKYALTLKIT